MKEIKVTIEIDGQKYGTTSKYTETAIRKTIKSEVKVTIDRLLKLMDKENNFIKH